MILFYPKDRVQKCLKSQTKTEVSYDSSALNRQSDILEPALVTDRRQLDIDGRIRYGNQAVASSPPL